MNNTIKWIDLSYSLQTFILNTMVKQFNKPFNDDEIHYRFIKSSCLVDLYYENYVLEGICVTWISSNRRFLYLDKFFSMNFKSGVGKHMLNCFIENYNTNMRFIVWRCDDKVLPFYLKHNKVTKYFNYKTNNKNINYLGIRQNNQSQSWEYEDMYDLKIKSCFL